MYKLRKITDLLAVILLFCLSSCASPPQGPLQDRSLAYSVDNKSELLHRHAPVFIVEEPEKDYNRIGTAEAKSQKETDVIINPGKATIYTSVRHFSTAKGSYTNLFYRIHFAEVPPWHLGTGKNVGLILVTTLNQQMETLLHTIVHTCGCYLSFIPTSRLPREQWPEHWPQEQQDVYSENLPAFLEYPDIVNRPSLTILIRQKTHRVKDIWLASQVDLQKFKTVEAFLQPFTSLENLSLPNGETTSFFETSGSRKGYVKNSQKIWERVLISWWAFDWRVGEDKKLGKDLNDGITFYTSLKPWARKESDLRDFPQFLSYWGWKL